MGISLHNEMVSRLKVEKVVNAPIRPTVNAVKMAGDKRFFIMFKFIRKLSRKHPTKLAISVAKGKIESAGKAIDIT